MEPDSDQSGSESEYVPSKSNSKKLQANVDKVVKRTSCQDKQRIMKLLRENHNAIGKVIKLIKQEKKALLKAAPTPSQAPDTAAVSESTVGISVSPLVPPTDNLTLTPCQDPQLEFYNHCELSSSSEIQPMTPQPSFVKDDETTAPSRKSPRREDSQDLSSPKKTRSGNSHKSTARKSPPSGLYYMSI